MEQRHHVQAAVGFAQREMRGDRVRRRDELSLADRHDLRSRRRARGVQDERRVVGARAPQRAAFADVLRSGRRDARPAGRRRRVDFELNDGQAQFASCSVRGAWLPGRSNDDRCARLLEQTSQFCGAEGRIQRDTDGARRDGQESAGARWVPRS